MMMNDNVQKLQELKIIPRSETSQRSAPSVVKKDVFFSADWSLKRGERWLTCPSRRRAARLIVSFNHRVGKKESGPRWGHFQ